MIPGSQRLAVPRGRDPVVEGLERIERTLSEKSRRRTVSARAAPPTLNSSLPFAAAPRPPSAGRAGTPDGFLQTAQRAAEQATKELHAVQRRCLELEATVADRDRAVAEWEAYVAEMEAKERDVAARIHRLEGQWQARERSIADDAERRVRELETELDQQTSNRGAVRSPMHADPAADLHVSLGAPYGLSAAREDPALLAAVERAGRLVAAEFTDDVAGPAALLEFMTDRAIDLKVAEQQRDCFKAEKGEAARQVSALAAEWEARVADLTDENRRLTEAAEAAQHAAEQAAQAPALPWPAVQGREPDSPSPRRPLFDRLRMAELFDAVSEQRRSIDHVIAHPGPASPAAASPSLPAALAEESAERPMEAVDGLLGRVEAGIAAIAAARPAMVPREVLRRHVLRVAREREERREADTSAAEASAAAMVEAADGIDALLSRTAELEAQLSDAAAAIESWESAASVLQQQALTAHASASDHAASLAAALEANGSDGALGAAVRSLQEGLVAGLAHIPATTAARGPDGLAELTEVPRPKPKPVRKPRAPPVSAADQQRSAELRGPVESTALGGPPLAPTLVTPTPAAAAAAPPLVPLPSLAAWTFDVAEVEAAVKDAGGVFFQVAAHVGRELGVVGPGKVCDEATWDTFALRAAAGYRPDVPFHCAMHAADVTQATYALLSMLPGLLAAMPDEEKLAVVAAALLHDYQHPGRNNTFLVATGDAVARRYNDRSVLESHHCAAGLALLDDAAADVTKALEPAARRRFRQVVQTCILGTDMTHHQGHLDHFRALTRGPAPAALDDPETRLFLVAFLMHTGDLSSSARSVAVAEEWTARIIAEFQAQGRAEALLGLPYSFGCAPGATGSGVQLEWVRDTVLPMYAAWAAAFPGTAPAEAGARAVLAHWVAEAGLAEASAVMAPADGTVVTPTPAPSGLPPALVALEGRLAEWSFSALSASDALRPEDGNIAFQVAAHVGRELGVVGPGKACDEATWDTFALRAAAGYRPDVPYHCVTHAADVTQATYALLSMLPGLLAAMPDEEKLAVVAAALLHDYQHPGRNNTFLVATGDAVARRYNDRSVLESHHCAAGLALLDDAAADVTKALDPAARRRFRQVVQTCILGTDMTHHKAHVKRVEEFAGTAPFVADNDAHRLELLEVLLHAADIGNPAKPVPEAVAWSGRLTQEQQQQGAAEAAAGLPYSFGCAPNPKVPEGQVFFIDALVLPMWRALDKATAPIGSVAVPLETLLATRQHWNAQHPTPTPPPPAPTYLPEEQVEAVSAEPEAAALAVCPDAPDTVVTPTPAPSGPPPALVALEGRLAEWSFSALSASDALRPEDGNIAFQVAAHVGRELGVVGPGKACDEATWDTFALRAAAGYRPDVPYHCVTHAADVTQATYALLSMLPGLLAAMPDEEKLAVVAAALLHDYQHPGRNNTFLVATGDAVARRYNDRSVLESHHCAAGLALLDDAAADVTKALDPAARRRFRQVVQTCILGTDMTHHKAHVKRVEEFAGTAPFVADNDAHRLELLEVLLHAADIGNPAKPVPEAVAWSGRLTQEQQQQGAAEAAAGLPYSFGCAPNPKVPEGQVFFIDALVLPMWRALDKATAPIGSVAVPLETLLATRQHWNAQHPTPTPPPPAPTYLPEEQVEAVSAEPEAAALAVCPDAPDTVVTPTPAPSGPPPALVALEGRLAEWSFSALSASDALRPEDGNIAFQVAAHVGRELGVVGPGKACDEATWDTFALRAAAGYRPDVPYHCVTHAADVTQATYALLSMLPGLLAAMPDEEKLAVVAAALLHDYQHPGRNNTFLVATGDAVARRYNDRSVLESHHCAAGLALLDDAAADVTKALDPAARRRFRQVVQTCILGTDMTHHKAHVKRVEEFAGTAPFVADNDAHRLELLEVLLHAADIGNPAKPVPEAVAWSGRLTQEQQQQGAAEAAAGLPYSFGCAPNPKVPEGQVFFIDALVLPMWRALDKATAPIGSVAVPLETLLATRQHWNAQLPPPARPLPAEQAPAERTTVDSADLDAALAAAAEKELALLELVRLTQRDLETVAGEREAVAATALRYGQELMKRGVKLDAA